MDAEATREQPFTDESHDHRGMRSRPEHHLLTGGIGRSSWWSPTRVVVQHPSHPVIGEQRLPKARSKQTIARRSI